MWMESLLGKDYSEGRSGWSWDNAKKTPVYSVMV